MPAAGQTAPAAVRRTRTRPTPIEDAPRELLKQLSPKTQSWLRQADQLIGRKRTLFAPSVVLTCVASGFDCEMRVIMQDFIRFLFYDKRIRGLNPSGDEHWIKVYPETEQHFDLGNIAQRPVRMILHPLSAVALQRSDHRPSGPYIQRESIVESDTRIDLAALSDKM